MTCPNCGKEVLEQAISCGSCGEKLPSRAARPQEIDQKTASGVAWTLVVMGVLGFGFVVANSWTDWYSGLDYVGPGLLIIVGVANLIWVSRRK